MKLVQEHINEKFTSESDPIKDMGIGVNVIKLVCAAVLSNDSTDYRDLTPKTIKMILSNFSNYYDYKEIVFADDEDNTYGTEDMNNKYFEYQGKIYHIGEEETLNEKFTEDSDSIKDMGIGVYSKRDFPDLLSFHEWLCLATPVICNIKKVEDIFKYANKRRINQTCYDKLLDYSNEYVTIKGERLDNIIYLQNFVELIKAKVKEQKSVNEKFTEDSDPINDLGIGILHRRKFDTVKEAAEFYVEHINLLSKGMFKSKEDLKEYLSGIGKGNYSETRSLLRAVKNFVDGYDGEFKNLVIKEIDEWNKLQYVIRLRNAIREIFDFIDEAFTADSDPIRDMGIGIFKRKMNFTNQEELVDAILTLVPSILGTDKIPEDIINTDHNILLPHYYHTINLYLYKYFTYNNKLVSESNTEWCLALRQKLRDIGFEHPKSSIDRLPRVNEKFTVDSDPIHDMGIGDEIEWENLKEGDILYNDDTFMIVKGTPKKDGDILEIITIPFPFGNNKQGRDTLVTILKGRQHYVDLYLNSERRKTLSNWQKEFKILQPREIKKYLNETFTSDSDPIHDLGIGILSRLKLFDVLRCKERIEAHLETGKYKFYIEPGEYSVIIQNIDFKSNEVELVVATYSHYPHHFMEADIPYIGKEHVSLPIDKFSDHFEIVKSDVLQEKFTDETDPIVDMGIGMTTHFKELMKLFGNADTKKYIYSIVIDDSEFIDFWFYRNNIKFLPKNEIKDLFKYVTNIIDQLGFSYILDAVKFIEGYSGDGSKEEADNDELPRMIRFKVHPQFQEIFKLGHYRRSASAYDYNSNIDDQFYFYSSNDDNYPYRIIR
jgi:hypothetical protein